MYYSSTVKNAIHFIYMMLIIVISKFVLIFVYFCIFGVIHLSCQQHCGKLMLEC